MSIEFNNAPLFVSLDSNLKARLIELIHTGKDKDAETVLTILGYTNVPDLLVSAKIAVKEAAAELAVKDFSKKLEAAVMSGLAKLSLPADLAGVKYTGLMLEVRYTTDGVNISATSKVDKDTWFINALEYQTKAVDPEGKILDGYKWTQVTRHFGKSSAKGGSGKKRSGTNGGKKMFTLKEGEDIISAAAYAEKTYPELFAEKTSGSGNVSWNRELVKYLGDLDNPSDPVVEAALKEAGYTGSTLKDLCKAIREDKSF